MTITTTLYLFCHYHPIGSSYFTKAIGDKASLGKMSLTQLHSEGVFSLDFLTIFEGTMLIWGAEKGKGGLFGMWWWLIFLFFELGKLRKSLFCLYRFCLTASFEVYVIRFVSDISCAFTTLMREFWAGCAL